MPLMASQDDAGSICMWTSAAPASAESGVGSSGNSALRTGPQVLENFDKLESFVQSLLNDKCAKEYTVPTILIIDAYGHHVPLTTAEDRGLAVSRALAVPPGCRLLRAYLRMNHNVTGELEYFPILLRPMG